MEQNRELEINPCIESQLSFSKGAKNTLSSLSCEERTVFSTYDNGKTKNEIIDQLWSKWNIKLINHKYNVGAKVSNRRQVVEALLYK